MDKLKWCSFGAFGYAWGISLTSQYFQTLLLDYDISIFHIGAILSSYPVCGIILQPYFNKLSDKIQRRKPLLILSGVAGSVVLFFLIVKNMKISIALIFLFFVFFTIYEGIYKIFISEQTENKSLLTLHFALFSFAGGICSFLVGGIILHIMGWETGNPVIFSFSAIILLLVFLIPVLKVQENFKGNRRNTFDRRILFPSVLPSDIQKDRRIEKRRKNPEAKNKIIKFCKIHGLYIFALGAFNSFHIFFLKKNLQFSDSSISFLMLEFVLFNILGVTVAFFYSKKISPPHLLLIVLAGLSFLTPVYIFVTTTLETLLLTIPVGIFIGGVQTIPFTVINQISAERELESSLSIYLRYSYIGSFLSGFLLGIPIELWNKTFQNTNGYFLIYVLSGSFFLLSGIQLSIWVRKEHIPFLHSNS